MRDLDRGEAAVRDPPHPDLAVAPRLGRQPLDRVVAVLGLARRCIRRGRSRATSPFRGRRAGTARSRAPRATRRGSRRSPRASRPCRYGIISRMAGNACGPAPSASGSGSHRFADSSSAVRHRDPDVAQRRDAWIGWLAGRARSASVGVGHGRENRARPARRTRRPGRATMAPMTDPSIEPPSRSGHGRAARGGSPTTTRGSPSGTTRSTRPDGSPGIYGVVHFANLAVGRGRDRRRRPGPARRPASLHPGRVLVGDPGGRRAGRRVAARRRRRELREETGVEADGWRELCRFHLSNSISDEAGVLFAARAGARGPRRPDPTEDLAIRWVPFEEALAMIARRRDHRRDDDHGDPARRARARVAGPTSERPDR